MLNLGRIRPVATNVALAALLSAAGAAAAQEDGSRANLQIYQQRAADGRIILTDRPVADAVTQRSWQIAPDPASSRQRREERREQARLEALVVTERIQRQIEAERQRDHELVLARMQLAEAEARLDAERARADAAAQRAVVFVPTFARRPFPFPPRLPRPGPPRPRVPIQPGFGMFGDSQG